MRHRLIFPLLIVLLARLHAASPLEAYHVVWDSPSLNHHGSMPLGNGDLAINAWVTREGGLQLYLAKTDAWDEYGRLVKIGKVRVQLDPNPFAGSLPFRQELQLGKGTIEVSAGPAEVPVRLRLWVDAHHPCVHVEIESAQPIEAAASFELWRTNRHELAELQVSDVLLNRKLADKKQAPTVIEPDLVLTNLAGRIGWLHHNQKSVGPQLLAEVQGLTGFPQTDPLLHRAFGALIFGAQAVRADDTRLRFPKSRSHRVSILALTRHPCTPETWLADADKLVRDVESQPFETRRAAHESWWADFWNRSWIRASLRPGAAPADGSLVPTNRHPLRVGMDQSGGNVLRGELGRVSVFNRALTAEELQKLAQTEPNQPQALKEGLLFADHGSQPRLITNSAAWNFSTGLTIEAWVKPAALAGGGARLLDKITPGGGDGFLLDTHPGNSLRFICGQSTLAQKDALPAGRWSHVAAVADPAAGGCRLYLGGKQVSGNTGAAVRDEAAHVSQMYHLQRFITACAGRGAFPIKFNGSLFTVPPGPTEKDPDYRRWGPGYWWQNTRLPYLSLCAAGDFDLQRPLFKMYAEDLLPLAKYRTKHYLGHDGAFYPECIYFWGPMFSETYGWTPFEQRRDKLQESGWHKWEWVGGLELSWMMLDYYDHALDREFLHRVALPFTREILTFFDQHYPTNARGQLVMHPSQALETWWRCTNAMPELAGCRAVVERLLALPDDLAAPAQKSEWRRFAAKLPPIPLREVDGKKALAPAEFFDQKRNIENPELYAVFPFRLFAFNRPNVEWALAALRHRWDRGNHGWRQDDIFLAYLGLAAEARQYVVGRARSHDRQERFPAFWGPNYDWTPDQDHGGVLMKALQAMLLQTDGDKIYLFPAWPAEWEVDFKLHAPRQTVLQGRYRDGRLQSLQVTPASRRADVELRGRTGAP